MTKKKQPPLTLIVAESDDLRIVQVSPGRFVLERRLTDAHGDDAWVSCDLHTHEDVLHLDDYGEGHPRVGRVALPGLGGLVDLVRGGSTGLIDIRAPWQVALTGRQGLLVLGAFVVGFILAHILGVSPAEPLQ